MIWSCFSYAHRIGTLAQFEGDEEVGFVSTFAFKSTRQLTGWRGNGFVSYNLHTRLGSIIT